MNYKINDNCTINIKRETDNHRIDIRDILKAVQNCHEIIDEINDFKVDIFSILGMRNLSAFIGELLVLEIAEKLPKLLMKNPHQDGYPDLLLLSKSGKKEIKRIRDQNLMLDKAPFSPFIAGGIEVKATCGAIPSAKDFNKKGIKRCGIGDQRIDFMKSYDWKAHHQETNNLLGILWDFINGIPRIVSVFYSNELTKDDWGEIVTPKKGGGRTTSVSIMTRRGIKKMYNNWVIVYKGSSDEYAKFLDKRNKDNLIQATK